MLFDWLGAFRAYLIDLKGEGWTAVAGEG